MNLSANEYLRHRSGYKIRAVRRNPGLFNPSSFLECFDSYNCHSQGQDVE